MIVYIHKQSDRLFIAEKTGVGFAYCFELHYSSGIFGSSGAEWYDWEETDYRTEDELVHAIQLAGIYDVLHFDGD